jgi:hypothetical protein
VRTLQHVGPCRAAPRPAPFYLGPRPRPGYALPTPRSAYLLPPPPPPAPPRAPPHSSRTSAAARFGAFVVGADRFDNTLFGVSHSEAEAMDPQQRLLLEHGYGALHASGAR